MSREKRAELGSCPSRHAIQRKTSEESAGYYRQKSFAIDTPGSPTGRPKPKQCCGVRPRELARLDHGLSCRFASSRPRLPAGTIERNRPAFEWYRFQKGPLNAHHVLWSSEVRLKHVAVSHSRRYDVPVALPSTESGFLPTEPLQRPINQGNAGDVSFASLTLSSVPIRTSLPPASARSLIRHAVDRGVVSRLEPGLFVLAPPELGRATEVCRQPICGRATTGGGC